VASFTQRPRAASQPSLKMLTHKCRPRDSRVRARAKTTQNRLCHSDQNLRRQNLAGFSEKLGLSARPILVPGRSGKEWLCWQSAANPSLPAKAGNAGRFRQKAARAATDLWRKSPHLNVLDVPLPDLASTENPAHSREGGNISSQVGGVRFKPKSRLPPPLDRCPLMTPKRTLAWSRNHSVVVSMTTPRPAQYPTLVFQRLSYRQAAEGIRTKGLYPLMHVKLGV